MPDITRSVEKQVFVIAAFRHDRQNALIYNKSELPKSIAKKVEQTLANPEGGEVISIRRVYQSVTEFVMVPELPVNQLDKFSGKPSQTVKDVLIEELAALEHEQWAFWVSKVLEAHEKDLPPELVAKWRSKTAMPYSMLSEEDKEHDRKWSRLAVDEVFKRVL